MKHKTLLVLTALVLGTSPAVFADGTYQATGPILQLTDSAIIIQKGSEKWEIARTADTKVTGDLKVGAKVTVQYTMTATAVEVKPAKDAPKTPPVEKPKPAKAK